MISHNMALLREFKNDMRALKAILGIPWMLKSLLREKCQFNLEPCSDAFCTNTHKKDLRFTCICMERNEEKQNKCNWNGEQPTGIK